MPDEREKWRANYVAAPAFFSLNHACRVINDAFPDVGCCYLVGSAIERRDHRDVDVRFIMEDEAYANLFLGKGGWLNPRWSLLCVAISAWLSRETGLPVDFQIQQQTNANQENPDKPRQALGFFLDYPGRRPGDGAPDPG